MSDEQTRRKYKEAGKRRLGSEKFRYRHRRAFRITIVALAAVVVAGGAYAFSLNSKFGNITRVPQNQILEENRPDPDKGKALNILILGTDAGDGADGGNAGGQSIKADVQAAQWPSGKYRSDSVMVLHISADRKSAHVVSIPRDTLAPLHDATGAYRYNGKINAAFSFYGPTGALSTVENLGDVRLDHMVMIDWVGFRDLSTALGGVKIYVPETSYDSSQRITWERGWHELKGKRALAYVRTRHGLAEGDYGRIKRQQNFIRATMKQLMARGTLTNPIKLNNVLEALTQNVIVDAEWESGDIRALALSLRGLNSNNVTFLTLPTTCCGNDTANGSYVQIDEQQSAELWQALKDDDVDAYLEKYPDEKLGGRSSVQ